MENSLLSNNKSETNANESGNISTTDLTSNVILEQYKLYVEMTDRISSRRIEANKYYTSILSGLLAIITIFGNNTNIQKPIIISASVLSMSLCIIWIVNLRSYQQLNSVKFKVIHEMEKLLPFACYDREWEIMNSRKKYYRLTQVEQFAPMIIIISNIALLFYALQQ